MALSNRLFFNISIYSIELAGSSEKSSCLFIMTSKITLFMQNQQQQNNNLVGCYPLLSPKLFYLRYSLSMNYSILSQSIFFQQIALNLSLIPKSSVSIKSFFKQSLYPELCSNEVQLSTNSEPSSTTTLISPIGKCSFSQKCCLICSKLI